MSTISRAVSFESYSFLKSGLFIKESSRVTFRSSGTILAKRSASAKATSLPLAMSRTTILAPKVPKVMILATQSLPYFSRTYSMTSTRRLMQKSMSKSGGEIRSGFRNRSKSNPKRKGSMSVMLSKYATRHPAPEPRPGPTGMPCSRDQLIKSATIRK